MLQNDFCLWLFDCHSRAILHNAAGGWMSKNHKMIHSSAPKVNVHFKHKKKNILYLAVPMMCVHTVVVPNGPFLDRQHQHHLETTWNANTLPTPQVLKSYSVGWRVQWSLLNKALQGILSFPMLSLQTTELNHLYSDEVNYKNEKKIQINLCCWHW